MQSLGAYIKSSLTVLQVLPALQGGGVERGTLEVAAELVRRGHRSLVVSAGGRLLPELLASGSEHINYPLGRKSLSSLRYVVALRRLLKLASVDVVHARSRLPAWITWLAWSSMDAATRPRFITTLHGLYSVNAYSAVMTKGEQVIAVSAVARDYALRHYPAVDPARLQVIHRGVDPAVFPKGFRPRQAWLADWTRRYPQLQDRYVITLPGRVGPRKGALDFIALIGALRHAGHNVHGLIVGEIAKRDRTLARQLKTAVKDAGIADALTCTGFREDVREIMSVSGAVVSLSSYPEAFGRTVNEALSLGVPVAGYDHGGVGEQLARHFPAGRVPFGNRVAMAERLADWIALPPAMVKVQPYTLDDMLNKTLDLYQRVAATDR
ncbi:MAG: glycosyltransferase family 4 protein [Gammaproteobacteria bacterium]